MSIGTSSTVAPGWYADPMAPGQARWWSGLDWTHHVQPLASVAQPGGSSADTWTAIAGILLGGFAAIFAIGRLAVFFANVPNR